MKIISITVISTFLFIFSSCNQSSTVTPATTVITPVTVCNYFEIQSKYNTKISYFNCILNRIDSFTKSSNDTTINNSNYSYTILINSPYLNVSCIVVNDTLLTIKNNDIAAINFKSYYNVFGTFENLKPQDSVIILKSLDPYVLFFNKNDTILLQYYF